MSARDPDRKGMDTTGVVEYGAQLDKYNWDQTRGEVTCTILQKHWPKDLWDWDARQLKVQNLDVKLTINNIKVGIKGKGILFEGKLFNRINTDDSTWTWGLNLNKKQALFNKTCLIDGENNTLEFTLIKDMTVHDSENPWWASFVQDDEKIDVDLIEGSKYLDVSLLRKIKAEKEKKKAAEMASKEQKEESAE